MYKDYEPDGTTRSHRSRPGVKGTHGEGWTDERTELLKKLWIEGLSASQIRDVLGGGVSRNGVIGKVHRLKLEGRAKPMNGISRVRTKPRSTRLPSPRNSNLVPNGGGRPSPRSPTPRKPGIVSGAIFGPVPALFAESRANGTVNEDLPPPIAELYIPVEQRLSLMQVNEHTCKWPIGDPLTPDFYFCGQQAEDGQPYCEFHARRAYRQIDKPRRGRRPAPLPKMAELETL